MNRIGYKRCTAERGKLSTDGMSEREQASRKRPCRLEMKKRKQGLARAKPQDQSHLRPSTRVLVDRFITAERQGAESDRPAFPA